MSAQSPRKRRSPSTQAPRSVRTSVPLDVSTHVKLSALAAMRGMPAGALAAEFVREGVRSIVVIDKRRSADPVDSDSQVDRPDAA